MGAAHKDGEIRIIYADDHEPLPANWEFWRHVQIEPSTGMVLHDATELEVRKAVLKAGVIFYRRILVHRDDLEKVWTIPAKSLEPLPVHPAPEDELLGEARNLYRQPGKPPNLAEAEKLLMAKFPGTSRDKFIRPLLRRDEFKKLRLPPGNQRKV